MNPADSDDDIPVLTDAVERKARGSLSREQIDALCDSLAAESWVLLDGLLTEALQDMHEQVRERLNERLGEELPALIEKALQEKLGHIAGK